MAFRCDDPLADEPDFAGQESVLVMNFNGANCPSIFQAN